VLINGILAAGRGVTTLTESQSPESVVRKYLASWADFNLDAVCAFFDDDALFVDGPRGVHNGIEAIRSQLEIDKLNIRADVKSLVAEGETVMLERVDNFTIGDKAFSMEVMAAFEVNSAGLIRRWHESYDLRSITDEIEAAGFRVPS
jgi:limonene-1,2-epoxide hydrolase